MKNAKQTALLLTLKDLLPMTINQELEDLELTLFHKNEQVFSGKIHDLPDFIEREQPADRVKFYGVSGSAVALMHYRDLLKLLEVNQ